MYMDDFTPYGDDFELALQTLEKLLQRCIATRLCLSHEKCHMMMTEGLILGHYISTAGIQVDVAKIQIILLIPTPTTKTEVHSFLGFSGYYRRFIKNFTKIVSPIFKLLTKDCEIIWNSDCQKSLETLKDKIFEAPILR